LPTIEELEAELQTVSVPSDAKERKAKIGNTHASRSKKLTARISKENS